MLAAILFSLMCVAQSRNVYDLFDDWSTQFHVLYRDNAHRETVFSKWLSNHRYIDETNARNLTYSLGHNQFSGLDNLEFRKFLGIESERSMLDFNSGFLARLRSVMDMNSKFIAGLITIPASVDWVERGGVTSVKDQGQCGSCWSFSATGALEGAYFVATGKLQSFSEQQLVDCDTLGNGGRDHGCNGGLMDYAFDWIHKNKGLCLEVAYPYVSGTTKGAGSCQKSCANVEGSEVITHVDISTKSDVALMTAVDKQPVSVAIEADQRDFQLYKSGVFTGACGTNLDHGVLVVGYGSDGANDYYKIKNSWSTTWGEAGYIRIGRGEQYNNGAGQCGVLLQASYPVV